ncbi:hypothetical protein HN371_29295 [Candidatus Poribacteria bacterium]|jgi:hypothetical protein|nr:hypothetical protein [Candidatus Poribacteria bacterium]MBT5533486.1 hypothetical protein [Candidatus Poribacteria bacterium]MBT7100529.1 hypothetical protein [Candidatus Poribacteria bacterium]MBT7808903.1 hypothetical protein [Candidatus Poribacteria bacterium]
MLQRRTRERPTDYLDFDGWIGSMPGDALLLLYEGGEYIAQLSAHEFATESTGLETLLLRELGPGRYTVVPHHTGRMHGGRPAHVGDPADVAPARRRRRELSELRRTAAATREQDMRNAVDIVTNVAKATAGLMTPLQDRKGDE